MTNSPANPNFTIANFNKEMREFVAHAKSVEGTDGQSEPKFPEFKITDDIRHKIAQANDILEKENFSDDDLRTAFLALTDVRNHFANKQRRYARDLLPGLQADRANLAQGCPDDLFGPARKAVDAYESLVSASHFSIKELDRASELYKTAISKLNWAQDTWRRRLGKQARRAGKTVNQQTEAQRQAAIQAAERRAEQLRETQRAERVQTARELRQLVATL